MCVPCHVHVDTVRAHSIYTHIHICIHLHIHIYNMCMCIHIHMRIHAHQADAATKAELLRLQRKAEGAFTVHTLPANEQRVVSVDRKGVKVKSKGMSGRGGRQLLHSPYAAGVLVHLDMYDNRLFQLQAHACCVCGACVVRACCVRAACVLRAFCIYKHTCRCLHTRPHALHMHCTCTALALHTHCTRIAHAHAGG